MKRQIVDQLEHERSKVKERVGSRESIIETKFEALIQPSAHWNSAVNNSRNVVDQDFQKAKSPIKKEVNILSGKKDSRDPDLNRDVGSREENDVTEEGHDEKPEVMTQFMNSQRGPSLGTSHLVVYSKPLSKITSKKTAVLPDSPPTHGRKAVNKIDLSQEKQP